MKKIMIFALPIMAMGAVSFTAQAQLAGKSEQEVVNCVYDSKNKIVEKRAEDAVFTLNGEQISGDGYAKGKLRGLTEGDIGCKRFSSVGNRCFGVVSASYEICEIKPQ